MANKIISYSCFCTEGRYLDAGGVCALALPEVKLSQIEAGSGVGNLYRPINHLHLVLLHSTRRLSLPANHKLARRLIDAVHAEQSGADLEKHFRLKRTN